MHDCALIAQMLMNMISPFHEVSVLSHPLVDLVLSDKQKAVTAVNRGGSGLHDPHLYMSLSFDLYQHEVSVRSDRHAPGVHHLRMIGLLQ